jgi:hypothetical protein
VFDVESVLLLQDIEIENEIICPASRVPPPCPTVWSQVVNSAIVTPISSASLARPGIGTPPAEVTSAETLTR